MRIALISIFMICASQLSLATENVEVVRHSSNYDALDGFSDEEQGRVSSLALDELKEKCGDRKLDVLQFDIFPVTMINEVEPAYKYQIRTKALCFN